MDAPKCLKCYGKEGNKAQTYRIAGTNKFRCSDCKAIYPKESFQPIEFIWKDDPKEWKRWMTSKGIKVA